MKKNNLKNERGVTITSVLIYIIALTAVVIIIGRISTYFYRNMDQVTTNTAAAAEYTKFNSYFTDEINIEGNEVEFWEPNLIIFSKSENQYTFQGNGIYRNKVKICKDVEACTFSYNEDTKKIDVYLKIYNREYNVTYTVAKEVTVSSGSNSETRVPEEKPEVGDTTFPRSYGVIEVEFLKDTGYTTTTTPNAPKMTSDMKAVYWDDAGNEIVQGEDASFDSNKWYNYIAQTAYTENGGTSKWANAKTEDGSYWVWIPRYAYRIVYFDTAEHANAYRFDNTQWQSRRGL